MVIHNFNYSAYPQRGRVLYFNEQHIHVSVSYPCLYSHPCFLGVIIKQSGCGVVDDTFLVISWRGYLIYKEEGPPTLDSEWEKFA